jgi:hypothetical protein
LIDRKKGKHKKVGEIKLFEVFVASGIAFVHKIFRDKCLNVSDTLTLKNTAWLLKIAHTLLTIYI